VRKILIILIIGAGILLVWQQGWFKNKISSVAILNQTQKQTVADQPESIKREIFTPPPLKSNRQSQQAFLSVNGVISQTNLQRTQNGGLPALKANARLTAAAQAKLNDMFAQQYFEHNSPQGRGPADLAKTAGYEYISVGENLAFGNFDNDIVLVQDWMDSPGHRANILNDSYEEIGVAVGQGVYDGKTVWLAVQEFGRPASSCPNVDENLKTEMANYQTEIDQAEPALNELKKYLDSTQPQTPAQAEIYNQKVADYNNLVKIYNNMVDKLKLLTESYNIQVRAYNACLD